MELINKSPVRSVGIEAVVIRANGYREDLGRIAYWNRSILKRLGYRIGWRKNGCGLFIPVLMLAEPGIRAHELKGLVSVLPLLPLATLQVNTGRAIVTGRLLGTSQAVPNQQGWGTGAGTTAATDTTLFTEVNDAGSGSGSRDAATLSQVTTSTTNDTEQAAVTKTASATLAITNAGLFDNATIGSGSLYMKGDFATINLNSGDSIAFTDKVQYS